MIDANFGRVAGISVVEEGTLAAVWLAYDKQTDTAHLYDCALFDAPMDRIAEGLNARGREIPVAWAASAKSVADRLLYDYGVNTITSNDAVADGLAALEMKSLVARLNGQRLIIDPRCKEWTREYAAWTRDEAPVPESPLLVATRIAFGRLDYARPRQRTRGTQAAYPRISLV